MNRFGYIRESVKLKANTPIEADYFGLMTSNREESLNEVKAALNGGNTEAVPYTAASAQIENHHAHCLVRHLALSAPRKPATDDLTRLMRASFARPPANALDVDKTVPVRTTHTFLYSLRSAALSPDPASRCEFLYNAKTYVLRTEKHCDEKVASELEKRNLVPQGARIMRLNGTIENQVKHERTGFTLWYQEGSATILPLRFEFRPKSFLRLVFDAEPVSRDALALNGSRLR